MADDSSKKRWLLKDQDGRVRGPYYTDDILKRIRSGEITGEELIALYPSADWSPISNDPEFYDRLLEILEGAEPEPEPDTIDLMSEDLNHDDLPTDFIKDSKKTGVGEKSSTNTNPADPARPKGRVESVSKTRIDDSDSKSSDNQVNDYFNDQRTRESLPNDKRGPTKSKATVQSKSESDIELKPRKKILKKAKARSASLPLILATVAVVGAVYYILTSGGTSLDDRVHLMTPRRGQPAIDKAQILAKQKIAIGEFSRDTFESYTQSEAELIQIVEGDPKNSAAISLLCLNYLELWPYSHQDSKDLYAITSAAQAASGVDPAGFEAATCRVVDLFIRGRVFEARSSIDTALNAFSGAATAPVAFYYLKARVFEIGKDYQQAISYAQSAEQIWPQWLRTYSFEAAMNAKNKNFNEAANRYRSILKSNPKHQVSQIQLGYIEYMNLNNYESGKRILDAAMKSGLRAPREIQAIGFLGLAEIALREQNMGAALGYAQKAYSLNSTEVRAKEIIVKIGGDKKLKETRIYDTQLVYEGDQLVREGDYNSAQAHYKEAFAANKKNGLAAMKAAECLWELSLSTEAIEWLNKAIQADPNLIDAYVLLADYFTQRFNFEAAGQILSRAQTVSKNNYKVYGGFALVEFRRNNFKGAIDYSQKAIQLYETDVDSYVILAKALLQNQEYPKAFETASKAIEMDMNNRKAQIAYAESLAMTRGMNVGIDYINRLVATYPTIAEYRMALGLLYKRDQSYTSAEQVLRQVTTIEDKPKQAFIELGKVLQLQKRYDEAVEAMFRAAALDPSDVEALYLSGLIYLEAKKPNDARTQFQRVMKINKDYPLVNYQIGRAELMMDSPQEALEQSRLESSRNPNLADPYLLAAEAHTTLKQYGLCAGDYMLAVKLRPQGADIYVKMARCYRLSGDLDSAVAMINQADRQESGNPEVWKEQGAIYDTRQDRFKAVDAYNQYLVLSPNAPDREQVQARIKALSQ